MARGDHRASDAASEQSGKKVQDWDLDALAVALCSDTFAASAAFTNISQFTKVSGGSYADQVPTATWTRAGSKSTLQATSVSWAQDAGGPTDCRVAVLFITEAGVVGNDDVLTVVDLTTDGTTPVSLQAGALNVNYASSATLEVDK